MSASTTGLHTWRIIVAEAVYRDVQNYCGPHRVFVRSWSVKPNGWYRIFLKEARAGVNAPVSTSRANQAVRA